LTRWRRSSRSSEKRISHRNTNWRSRASTRGPLRRSRPNYAQIHTADVQWEGTDATIRFDLTGTAGTVSTTLNADYKGVLEQDKFDWISLEGGNIGKVTALTATALTSDGDSGWQPILIKVVSKIDSNEAFFNYGPGDWPQKASGPLKRAADAAPAI